MAEMGGITTRRVECGGLGFRVVEAGSGPAVLLLHGFPDSSRVWRHQIPALAEGGWRVIAPDLRGFGESDRPEGVEAYAIPNLLGDVGGILDALGVDEVAIVGHDWGAFLAWIFSAFTPQRVSRLAALTVGHPAAYAGAGIRQRELGWYMLWFQFPGVAEEYLPRDDWRLMRAWLGESGDYFEGCLADLARPGALTAGVNWYRANITPQLYVGDLAMQVPPVDCPTLGVWADGDRFLTEEFMTGSAEFVKGPWRYERVAGGHWFPYQNPDATNRLLLEFLAG